MTVLTDGPLTRIMTGLHIKHVTLRRMGQQHWKWRNKLTKYTVCTCSVERKMNYWQLVADCRSVRCGRERDDRPDSNGPCELCTQQIELIIIVKWRLMCAPYNGTTVIFLQFFVRQIESFDFTSSVRSGGLSVGHSTQCGHRTENKLTAKYSATARTCS